MSLTEARRHAFVASSKLTLALYSGTIGRAPWPVSHASSWPGVRSWKIPGMSWSPNPSRTWPTTAHNWRLLAVNGGAVRTSYGPPRD